MTPITAQDIFNAAWQAFIIEGKPPAQEMVCQGSDHREQPRYKWKCRYLTSDGRKCAIGLVIPDGHPLQYSMLSFNGLLGEDQESDDPIFDKEILPQGKLHDTIQGYLHDLLADQGEWIHPIGDREITYRLFAKEHGLTIPGE